MIISVASGKGGTGKTTVATNLALSVGAKACSGGRWYLYALAGAGEAGVKRALTNMRDELLRDMKLMGM